MRGKTFLLALAATFTPPLLWAGPVPVGSDFRVNTYTLGAQTNPAVAKDRAGNFVVIYESEGQDGSDAGIFGRLYDSAGAPRGPEFRVNTYTPGSQGNPAVAMDGEGNFLVVWDSPVPSGPGPGIIGQMFGSRGEPWGGEFRIDDEGQSFGPAVAMNGSGRLVVAWSDNGRDGWGFGIFGQRLEIVEGDRPDLIGGEFQVNSFTRSWQSEAAVAINEPGEFVVAWRSWYLDGSAYAVAAQRFDRTGLAVAGEFQVNLFTAGNQYMPAVGMDDDGQFLVVWQSPGQDLSGNGILVRHFDSSGIGTVEGLMNSHTSGDQIRPAIAMDGSGYFLAAWESLAQDGSSGGIFADNWEPPPSGEFQVNVYTTGRQQSPAVALGGRGDFVIAWQDEARDGSGPGIFARQFKCHDLDADGLCDFRDITLTGPTDGSAVECLDPLAARPTITWDPGNFDRFRVFLSADPAFPGGAAQVSSGDTMLKGESWTPSRKQWKKACARALQADPFGPEIYIRILGVDRECPRKDQDHKTYSQVVHVEVQD